MTENEPEKTQPNLSVEAGKDVNEKLSTGLKILKLLEASLLSILKFLPSIKFVDIKKVELFITSFFVICTRLILVITSTALLIVSFKGLMNESYILDSAKIPEEFSKDGLDGAEFSNRIISEIKRIQKVASKSKDFLKQDKDKIRIETRLNYDFNKDLATEDVVLMGVSLNSVKQILRKAFGVKNKTITTSLIKRTKEMELNLRITDWKEPLQMRTVVQDGDYYKAIDKLIEIASIELLKISDPVIVSWYYISINDKENYRSAIEFVKEEIKKERPNSSEMYVIWGILLSKEKKFSQSLEKFEKAEKIASSDKINLYYAWINSLIELNEPERVIEKSKKLLSLKPNDSFALVSYGNALDDLKRSEEALEKYAKAINIDPNSAVAWNNWGNALFNLKRYPEAKEKFLKAIELSDDTYLSPLYNLGNTYYFLKELELAKKTYLNILEIDKNNIDAIHNLAVTEIDLGEYQSSLEQLKRVIKMDPNFSIAYLTITNVSFLLGNYQEGEKSLQISYEKNKNNKPYELEMNLYNFLYIKKNDLDLKAKILEQITQGVKLETDLKKHFEIAKKNEAINQPDLEEILSKL
ncbi:MAG: tetratricopeptide repeat protein [Leptospiraceae bacterium]|nr:tetratricopeptide repeat protein [Leptospiraceae bacterium]